MGSGGQNFIDSVFLGGLCGFCAYADDFRRFADTAVFKKGLYSERTAENYLVAVYRTGQFLSAGYGVIKLYIVENHAVFTENFVKFP